MPRRVCVVLCARNGGLLGALPPLVVESPWWPDVEPVVAAARDRFGVRLTVLRLLEADGRGPAGSGRTSPGPIGSWPPWERPAPAPLCR